MFNSAAFLSSKPAASPSPGGLLEFAHFGYMWTSLRTKKIIASHKLYEMLGIEPFSELLTSQNWSERVHVDDLSRLIAAEAALCDTRKQQSVEYRISTRDGRQITVCHHMRLSGAGSEDARIVSILDDITEQKRAEAILEVMNESFFELGHGLVFKRVNQKAENFWGKHKKELIGQGLLRVFPSAAGSSFYEMIETAASRKINISQNLLCPITGQWLRMSASPYSEGIVVVFNSIQREKEAESELIESRSFLQATLDSSQNLIQVFDVIRNDDHKIMDFQWSLANTAAKKVVGDVIGKRLIEHAPKDFSSITFEKLAKVADSGEQQYFEMRYIDHWYDCSGVSMPAGVSLTLVDITQRKKSEEKIEELNNMLFAKNRELESKNSELGTFTTIASNDYSDSLKQMYTNLEFISSHDAHKLSDIGRANLRRMQSSIQKIRLLTNDIIAFSKVQGDESSFAETDLNETVKQTLYDIRKTIDEAGAEVHADNLPVIKGFPLLISLLFSHLLSNALKFRDVSSGKLIQIKHAQVSGETLRQIGSISPLYEKISFIDQGIGFDMQSNDQIFKMFYKLHEKTQFRGSGIGLAICKKIMDLHNGFIIAESELGKGSSFHCFFPIEKS